MTSIRATACRLPCCLASYSHTADPHPTPREPLFKWLCSMGWIQPMTELPSTSFKFPRGIKRSTLRANARTSVHPFIHLKEPLRAVPLPTSPRGIGNSSYHTYLTPFFAPKLKSCRFSDVTVLATMQPTSHQGAEAGPCSAPIRKGTVRTHRTLTISPLPTEDTHTPPGTYPNNNTYATTTRRTFKGRSTNDATRYPRRSRRIVSTRLLFLSSLRPGSASSIIVLLHWQRF